MFGKKSNTIPILIAAIVIIAIVALVITNTGLREDINILGNSQNSAQQTYKDNSRVEIGGKKACLKHRSQPATRECKIGFLAEDGRYYMLSNPKKLEGVAEGQKVWVKGIYKKPGSKIYKTDGTIEVLSVSLNYGSPGGISL